MSALRSGIAALHAEDVSVRTDLASLDPADAGRDPFLGRIVRDALTASVDGGTHDVSEMSAGERDAAADVIAQRASVVSRDATLNALASALSETAARTESDRDELEAARAAALAIAQAATGDPAGELARIDALTEQAAAADAALARDSALKAGVALVPISAWVWPVTGEISQGFGPTSVDLEAPLTYSGVSFPSFHEGIDIAAPLGTPVVAAAAGKVTFVGHLSDGAMVVQVASADGLVELYAHLNDLASPPPMRIGDAVAPGQRIGTVGLTGITTGPHLHFGVYRGATPIDPLPLLPPRP